MNTVKTHRVRHTAWQTLVVNVGAGTAEHARHLAGEIRRRIGADPFQRFDGDREKLQPENLYARESREGGAS
jgi:hypothetical protein